MTIGKFQIKAAGEPPSLESLCEFLTNKCYFKRNGNWMEKRYPLGKNLLASLFMKVTYDVTRGVFAEWHIYDNGMANLIVEIGGRSTYAMKEYKKLADYMKRAAESLEYDLEQIEKFMKG